jgi:hypothetical protein
MAQRTWADASFRQKYQCPELGFEKIGNFRLEPQRSKAAFQEHPRLSVQPGNAVHVALGATERTGQGLHGEMIAVYRIPRPRYNAPPLTNLK